MNYIAHTSDDGRFQMVRNHLKNVAILGRTFSIKELKDICYIAGLFHDAGKYLEMFQKRINGDSSIHVEHSIIGAKIISEKYKKSPLSLMIEGCIAGHHTGIPDYGFSSDTADDITLHGKLQRVTDDYSAFFKEIDTNNIELNDKDFNEYLMSNCKTKDDLIEKFAFLTRYIFSCLTDADSIDTIQFVSGKKPESLSADFNLCLEKINNRFETFLPETELQKARSFIQKQVYCKSNSDEHIFLLNMPTGSGKTLCSTKFALERAIRKKKNRIIYVIPYNSIIDQTYEELKAMFGDNAEILRHQSTFSYSDYDTDENLKAKAISACENWNAEIIITTSVQFFDSIYDNKRKQLRKLHNYADSIIIFDEIHLMPVNNMQPCLRAIEFISSLLHSDIIFCTATMPDFRNLFEKYTSLRLPIVDLTEDKSYFHIFDKCSYKYIGEIADESLLEMACKFPSSLIVTNTRRKAKELFQSATGRKYHLSTYMTAFDRMNAINSIKSDLKKLEEDYPNLKNVPAERRILVVSTSLIEAGVDLDFFCAFREMTGLDSVLQTGGRCNREGKRKNSQVFVFKTEDASNRPVSDIRIEVAKGIIEKYDDFSCLTAIDEYYNTLYHLKEDKIISNSITKMMNKKDLSRIPFASYKFSMIDSKQISIFIPQDDKSNLLYQNMKTQHFVPLRAIQKYCCSVSEKEFDQLLKYGVLNNFDTDVYCLTNPDYYDSQTGIGIQGKDYFI